MTAALIQRISDDSPFIMGKINKCAKLIQVVNTQYNEELLIKVVETKYFI